MRLVHVFLRGPCRWVWQWLSPTARIALPRVTALALACGGPTARLPAEPVLAPTPAHERPVAPPVVWRDAPSPSILVYLPPRVDVRPAVAPDTFYIPGSLLNIPGATSRYVEHRYGDHDHALPVSDVPEPPSLAMMAALGVLAVRKWRRS